MYNCISNHSCIINIIKGTDKKGGDKVIQRAEVASAFRNLKRPLGRKVKSGLDLKEWLKF